MYTDDQRIKDLAISSGDMRIVARYFRTPAERQPFAWDITGRRDVLAGIATRYARGKPARTT
ncbi:MAG: hypothetical protein NVS2B16_30030 [Chloroflexota bacterium]